jgi:polyisoprenyl-phosphate glycosyltransferase
MTKISIVVPCYNEEKVISDTFMSMYTLLSTINLSYEIIFVDNGGTDGQLDLMKNLHNNHPDIIKVISLSRNFGYQMSMSAGLKYSSGDAVIFIDADLQDPPELIKEFINKWESGWDVVYGIREKREGPILLRIFYRLFYWFMNKSSDINIPRNVGEFGLINRKVADKILEMPERVRFIRGLRSWVGFKQTGIPYSRAKRLTGKTKFNFLGNITLALDGILSFSTRILTYTAFFGFFIFLISLFLICYIVAWKFSTNNLIPGYAATMVAISFFSGIIIMMLGIAGSIIERIFMEVKSRPHFIVKETYGIELDN